MHAALEILWTADEAARNGQTRRMSEDDGPSEDDPAIALATAQSILDAADITLPTGDLYNGAYDAFGNYYQLPHPIVSDPLNLVWRPGSEDEDLDDAKTDLTGCEETAEEREYADDEAERRREEKGKAVVDIRDQITVRARLSDGSRDVNVAVDKADTVRSIARLIAEEAQVCYYAGISLVFCKDAFPLTTSLASRKQENTHRLHGQDLERGLPFVGAGLEARTRRQCLGVQPVGSLLAGSRRRGIAAMLSCSGRASCPTC